MQQLLADRGVIRATGQTPLEMAVETGFSEVLYITTAYNRIRFSGKEVQPHDVKEISDWLNGLRLKMAELDSSSKQSRSFAKRLFGRRRKQ
jgi:hypothetical protein